MTSRNFQEKVEKKTGERANTLQGKTRKKKGVNGWKRKLVNRQIQEQKSVRYQFLTSKTRFPPFRHLLRKQILESGQKGWKDGTLGERIYVPIIRDHCVSGTGRRGFLMASLLGLKNMSRQLGVAHRAGEVYLFST